MTITETGGGSLLSINNAMRTIERNGNSGAIAETNIEILIEYGGDTDPPVVI